MASLGSLHDGFVPGRHLIDAYGNGGFRFADMSHRGSILAMPHGIQAWSPESAAEIDRASLRAVREAAGGVDEGRDRRRRTLP